MDKFYDIVNEIIEKVNGFLWGPTIISIMLGIGFILTLFTGFFQVTHFGESIKTTIGGMFNKKKITKKGALSPYQALTTALAGTLGTGNITGVATAIVSGGPGAIFWMWVSSFFGMITKYAEVALAVKYRETNAKGEYTGGPMYYIQNGLKCKPLAVIFAVFCTFTSFGIGNMVQANSASEALYTGFSINKIVSGTLIAIITAFVMLGGVKRIGKVTEKVVPYMAAFYIFAGILVLIVNFRVIPYAFSLIFSHAFGFRAAAGGVLGYTVSTAMRFGIARGIFTNEAGLGSAPIAHAAADTDNPVKQGMWGIFEVFFDTIVMCTLTALIILTSGLWDSGLDGSALTIAAFSKAIGSFSSMFIAISTTLFAFATIISWSYYGEKSLEYLFKERQDTQIAKAIKTYRIVYIILITVGSSLNLTLIWGISDVLNGLTMIPNLIALILLSPQVIVMTLKYRK